MFFVNFICVFYLMVLCKGHIISNAKSDNLYDNNEYPDGRDFKELLDAGNVTSFLENKYFMKQGKNEARKLQPENFNNHFTDYTPDEPQEKTASFWSQFTRNSKTKLDNDNNYYKQDFYSDKKSRSNIYLPYLSRGYNNNYDYNDQMDTKVNKHKGRHKYFGLYKKKQQKREANAVNDKMTVRVTLRNKFPTDQEATNADWFTEKCVTIDADKSRTPSYLNTKTTKPFITPFLNVSNNEMSMYSTSNGISNTNTENNIKKLTTDKTKLTETTLASTNHETKNTTLSTTIVQPNVASLFGTAEMEKLIEELKKSAMEIIYKHNPTVADVISNTATLITYKDNTPANNSTIDITEHVDFDPQSDLFTPALQSNNSEATMEHKRLARTVKSKLASITKSVNRAENKMKSNIKGVYKKWKGKLKKDFKNEVTKTNHFIHEQTYKVVNKISHTVHPPKKLAQMVNNNNSKNDKKSFMSHTTTPGIHYNTVLPRSFISKEHVMKPKNNHNILRSTEKFDEISTKGPVLEDDYVMLALYEKMLNKERDNYFHNLITTYENINDSHQENNNFIREFKKRQIGGSSDYNIDYNTQDMPNPQEDMLKSRDDLPSSQDEYQSTENSENPLISTSYEDLIKKISYKDYVNGYKHYLKFQKQLGDQNFSAQVRYQAHKHHNVDDIGKYILNKIPEIPNISRFKREPEYTTSKDFPWLKKHLKMFYERNTPKKFHTSETVTLKLPRTTKSTETNNPLREKSDITPIDESVTISESTKLRNDSIIDSNTDLDKLSQVLEIAKSKFSDIEKDESEIITASDSTSTSKSETHDYAAAQAEVTLFTYNILTKLFNRSHNDNEQFRTTEDIDDSRLVDFTPITYNYINDDNNGQHRRVKKSQYTMRNDDSDTKYGTTSHVKVPVTKFKILVTHNKLRRLTTNKARRFRKFFNLFKLKNSHNKDEKKTKFKRHFEKRATMFCPFKKLRYWLTANTKKDNIMESSSMMGALTTSSDYTLKGNGGFDYSSNPNYVLDWNDFAKDPRMDSFEILQDALNMSNSESTGNRYYENENNVLASMKKDLTSIFDLTSPSTHSTSTLDDEHFLNDYKFANQGFATSITKYISGNVPTMKTTTLAQTKPTSYNIKLKDSELVNTDKSSTEINDDYFYNVKNGNDNKLKETESVNNDKTSTKINYGNFYNVKNANDIQLKESELVNTDKSSTEINDDYFYNVKNANDIKLKGTESVNTDKTSTEVNYHYFYNVKNANQVPGRNQLKGMSGRNFYTSPKIQNSINVDKSNTQTSFTILDHFFTTLSEATGKRFPTERKQPGTDMPDYFNELLVWHGDLLHDNNNKHNGMYKYEMSVLDKYTQNLISLQRELADMRKFINKMNESSNDIQISQTLNIKQKNMYTEKATMLPTQVVNTNDFLERKHTTKIFPRRFLIKSEHEILQFKTNNKQLNNNRKYKHMYEQPSNDDTSVFDTENVTNRYQPKITTYEYLSNDNTSVFDIPKVTNRYQPKITTYEYLSNDNTSVFDIPKVTNRYQPKITTYEYLSNDNTSVFDNPKVTNRYQPKITTYEYLSNDNTSVFDIPKVTNRYQPKIKTYEYLSNDNKSVFDIPKVTNRYQPKITTSSSTKLKKVHSNKLFNYISEIDVLNKLLNDSTNITKTIKNYQLKTTRKVKYTPKYQARHVDHNFDSKKAAEFDKLLLDTTLLSYDDGLSFLMKPNLLNKAKKHHGGAVIYKKKDLIKAQINKPQTHPAQYFSTPLPMRSADFEEFLREHSLDVNSLTSTISNLKSYLDTWSNTKTPEHNKFTSKITTDMTKSKDYNSNYKKQHNSNYKKQHTTFSSPETKNNNAELKKLGTSLHLKHYDGKEFKLKSTTSNFNYMNYANKGNGAIQSKLIKSKKNQKIKRKIDFFHKKHTENKNFEYSLEPISLKDSPVEITVISLDDIPDFQNDKGERDVFNDHRNKSPKQSKTITFSNNDYSEESEYIPIDNSLKGLVNSKDDLRYPSKHNDDSPKELVNSKDDLRCASKHNDETHNVTPVKAKSNQLEMDSKPKFVESNEISEKNNIQKVSNGKESIQTTVMTNKISDIAGKLKVDTENIEKKLNVNKKFDREFSMINRDTTTKHHRHSIIKDITENLQHIFKFKYKATPTTDSSKLSEDENSKTGTEAISSKIGTAVISSKRGTEAIKSRDIGYQYDEIRDDGSEIDIDNYYGQNKGYFIDRPETTPGSISDSQFDSETNQDIKQIMTIADVIEAIENITRPNVMIHIDLPIYYAPENPTTHSQITYGRSQQSEKSNIAYYNILYAALMELLYRFGWLKIPVNEKTEGNIISSSSLYLMLLDFINKICLRAPVANLTDGFNNSDFNSDEVFRKTRDGSSLTEYSRKEEHRTIHKKDVPVGKNAWITFPTPIHKAVFVYDLKNIDSSTGKWNYKSIKENVNNRLVTTKANIKNNTRARRHDNNTGTRFVAKDVSGFEVIVDLINNSRNAKSEIQNADMTLAKHQNKKEDGNSIQVYIALPYTMELNNSQNGICLSKCIRKIFSAKLSTDVDLEFQVYTFADATMTHMSIKNTTQDLKDLYTMTMLPIIYTTPSPPFLKQTYINKSFQTGVPDKVVNQSQTPDEKYLNNIDYKETIRKGIDDINKQLLKVHENLTAVAAVINGTNIAPRNANYDKELLQKLLYNFIISNSTTKNINKDQSQRKVRSLKSAAIKKLFSNDRLCFCKCRVNKTMCRACAASDAVISEIIFEFDNLSNYMNSHCTEIQTYFFMNPTGGRKLKDSVHRLDRVLNDYYRRVKGKCQGPTCKSLAGMQPFVNVNKRSNNNLALSDFITTIHSLSSTVKLLLDAHNNDKIANRTKCFLIETEKCFHAPINGIYKWNRDRRQAKLTNLYSVDKFNINILTNSNRSKDSYFVNNLKIPKESTTTSKSRHFNTTSSTYITQPESLRDYENVDEYNKSTINTFDKLKKMWPNIFHTRGENVYTFTEILYPEEPSATHILNLLKGKPTEINKRNHKRKSTNIKKTNKKENFAVIKKTNNKAKRNLDVQYTQLESPLITDPGGMFWNNYLLRNSIKEVTAKISQFHNVTSMHTKSKTDSVKSTKKKSSKKSNKNNEITNATQSRTTHNMKYKFPYLVDKDYQTNNPMTMFKLHSLINELGNVINLLSSTTPVVINERAKNIFTTTKLIKTSTDRRHFTNKLKTSPLSHYGDFKKHSKKVNNTATENNTLVFVDKNTKKVCNTTTKNNTPVSVVKNTKKVCNTTTINNTPVFVVKNTKKVSTEKNTPVDVVKDTKRVFNITIVKTPEEEHYNHVKNNIGYNHNKSQIDLINVEVNISKEKPTSNTKYNKSNIHHNHNEHHNEHHNNNYVTKSTSKSITNYITNFLTEYEHLYHTEESELPPDDTYFTKEGNNKALTKNPTIIIIGKALKKLQEPLDEISESKSNENVNLLELYGLNENDEKELKHVDDKYHDLLVSILNHDVRLRDDRDIVTLTQSTTSATSFPYDVVAKASQKDKNIDNRKWQSKFAREITTKKKCFKKYHEMVKTSSTHVIWHASSKPTHPAVINELPTTTPTTTTTTSETPKEKETFEPVHPPLATLCDLQVTQDHVLERYRTQNKNTFCTEAKHIECFKRKPAPSYLIIEPECSKKICKRKPEDTKPLKVFHQEPKTKRHNGLRFDWIRRKRSLLSFNGYDTYVRDKYGIYRSSTSKKSRIKRKTDLSRLYDGLRDLPSFDTQKDVVHVLAGDTVTLHCNYKCSGECREFSEYVWLANRPGMLKMENVAVESTTVSITSASVKNDGEYNCTKHGTTLNHIKLTVITLPKYHIIFIPTYSTGKECHYDDLTAVSSNLGPEMSTIACERQCSIRIDEPVCMKEQQDAKTALRVIAIMTSKPHFNVKCSAECLRDLHSSFTLLCATNIPPLMEIGLVITDAEKNRTFPVFYVGDSNLIVTHTLRRKDSNQHHEYHKLVSRMEPGDIDVVPSCQAGFELQPLYKICVPCPVNTFAIEGANHCSPCPPGSRSIHPGSGKCLNVITARRRRYDWVVQVPLGYSITCAVVLCLCGVGLIGGMVMQCLCKGQSERSVVHNLLMERDKGSPRKRPQVCPVPAPPQAKRPLSPSKVILARLFRSSHTSRATDSQETKFGLWRGKTSAPPIPPIDFDM